MAVMESTVPPFDVNQYTELIATEIAEHYADGESFKDLHEAQPGRYPSPFVLYRWRRTHSLFKMLMIDARAVRAELLAEQMLDISDDRELLPAQVKNSMEGRLKMAAALDATVYGSRKIIAGDAENPLLMGIPEKMSDDELLRVIHASQVIETPPDGGGHPPLLGSGPVDTGVEGSSTPASKLPQDLVASNASPPDEDEDVSPGF